MLVIDSEQMLNGGGFSWVYRTDVGQKLREELRSRHDFTFFKSDSSYKQAEQEIREGGNWDRI